MKMYSLSKNFPKYAHSVDSKTNASIHLSLRYRKKRSWIVGASWNPHGSWTLILCVMSLWVMWCLLARFKIVWDRSVLQDGAHRYAIHLSHTHTYIHIYIKRHLRDWYLGGIQGWTAMLCFQELCVWVASVYVHSSKWEVACVTCGHGLYSVVVFSAINIFYKAKTLTNTDKH